MQSRFEKQVQEKMDELEFVPTEPVWQNIEKQIRTRKVRRRFFLWLPFLFLLLGGGFWWAMKNHPTTNTIAVNNTITGNSERKDEKNNYQITPQQQTITIEQDLQKTEHNSDLSLNTPQKKSSTTFQNKNSKAVKDPSSFVKQRATVDNSVSPQKNRGDITRGKDLNKGGAKKAVAVGAKSFDGEGKADKEDKAIIRNPNKSDADQILRKGTIDSGKKIITSDSSGYKTADTKQKGDSSATEEIKKIQKISTSKRQFGIVARAGFSGIGKGIVSFGKAEAMTNPNSNAGPPPNNSPPNNSPAAPVNTHPSPISNAISFSVGLVVKESLAKRISLSTGLQYNYYSTQFAVGEKLSAATSSSAYGMQAEAYLNSGTNFENYHNRYHFISLPVLVDWQMLKHIPLNLQAGLSFQKLINTNALIYDPRRNLYYKDDNVFDKTQFFSTIGFSYALFNKKKSYLLIGPQMQYGISSLEKNDGSKHLFSFGISTQFFFQKK